MSDIGSTPVPNTPFFAESTLADVIIPRHLHQSFTYTIPSGLQGRVFIGCRVLVPFGSTTLLGIVVSLSAMRSEDHSFKQSVGGGLLTKNLREIAALLDDSPESGLPKDLITLSHLVSERYLTPWGQCLRLILPTISIHTGSRRYLLTDSGRALLGQLDGEARLSSSHRSVLSRLADAPKGLSLAVLQRTSRGPLKNILATLQRRRLVHGLDQSDRKRPARRIYSINEHSPEEGSTPDHDVVNSPASPLPHEIRRIYAAIGDRLYTCMLLPISIHQRMEYLMQAAEGALLEMRTALIITPEIARAESVARRMQSRWGNQVGLFHGRLTAASRAEVWSRTRRGRIRLVVGTRSAIFSPLHSLGLICVEDEQDPLLKEETEPRYHARDVAVIRAQLHGAALVFLTAHPSLETLQTCRSDRVGDNPTPDARLEREPIIPMPSFAPPLIQTVDLREQSYGTLLSEPMITGIAAAIDARAGAMLFLNRKGFAPALLCRECGTSPRCPQCSIAMTFHRQAGQLACCYCGTRDSLPDACPSCLAARLEPVGAGTERVEAMVRRQFPTAKIGRLDKEISRHQIDTLRRQVISGAVDILVGTQMLFQGNPLPPVGFVGLVLADAGLHLPDFRAGEHTYHRLMHAVSMARPRELSGSVVLQTYLPTHHVIAAVREQQPKIFYDQELAFRRMLDYPPFSHIISLRVSGRDEDRVRYAAERWAKELKANAAQSKAPSSLIAEAGLSPSAIDRKVQEDTYEVSVLGPVPSVPAQHRGRYRWQLLVKSVCAETARAAVRMTLSDRERIRGRSSLKYEVDVDPVVMM